MASDSSALNHDKVQCYYVSPDASFPLFTSPGVYMHKCEKCSREFCSLLNCRRHMRCHRKPLQPDREDLGRERESISQFWAQLPPDKASEILSVAGSQILEISGSRVLERLQQFLKVPSCTLFPYPYFKAGAKLWDAIHKKTETLSTDELFSALDDASEKAFLALGTSDKVAQYVYRKDQEDRDAIASWAFLMEDKMMQAWRAEKDARAQISRENLVIELTREEENRKLTREENKKPKRGKKAKKQKKKKGLVEGTEIQKLEGGSSAGGGATGSEGSDQEKADAETWADEPDPEKCQDNLKDVDASSSKKSQEDLKDADASSSKTQVFPVSTDELEHEHSPVGYRPNPHRSSKVTNAKKDANGYYYRWARKDKGARVSDACTTIDRREDECVQGVQRKVFNQQLGTDNSRSRSGQSMNRPSRDIDGDGHMIQTGTDGNGTEETGPRVEVTANIIGMGTDNNPSGQTGSRVDKLRSDGQVEEPLIGTASDSSRAEQSDSLIEVENVGPTGSRMDNLRPDIQVEELMIGTVIIPLHALALDSSRPLHVPFRRFDSLEKELLSPEREEVQEELVAGMEASSLASITGGGDAEQEVLTENEDPEGPTSSEQQVFAKVADACRAFLSKRWDDALDDSETLELTEATSKEDGSQVVGGESVKVGNFDVGEPKGDEVGREEEGGGISGFEGDRRIDGRNGTYKKAGSRKRSKAWEPKKQAPD